MQPDANHPLDFLKLTASETRILSNWIKLNFLPRKSPNRTHTSYGLKHIFEHSECGFYITNGMFKGAMMAQGYIPVDKEALNCHFRISQKSPAFKNGCVCV